MDKTTMVELLRQYNATHELTEANAIAHHKHMFAHVRQHYPTATDDEIMDVFLEMARHLIDQNNESLDATAKISGINQKWLDAVARQRQRSRIKLVRSD